MYRDKFIYGLMAASALFAACSDDFGVADGPKHPVSEGDEILFGAKNLATFKDGFTDGVDKGGRTVYGDAEYVQNADGTGYWKYPLSWIYGDSISIYSPQATFPNDGGKGFANYIMVLGIIETVALFALAFAIIALPSAPAEAVVEAVETVAQAM